MAGDINLKADKYYASSTERVADQANVPGGSTAEDCDTGNRYVRSSTGWITISIGGAGRVIQGEVGQARNRIVSVSADTLPVLATSGVASWSSPGVKGIVITGARVVSGTVPLTNENWRVRYSIDAPNDATDAAWLPTTTNAASATADIGMVGGFDVTPIVVSAALDASRIMQIILPNPIEIPVSTPITRLGLAHNIGSDVVLEFVISAVEVS